MFEGHTVDVLHGGMSEDEKEQVIRRFANGSIKLLLATTVVEVRVQGTEGCGALACVGTSV